MNRFKFQPAPAAKPPSKNKEIKDDDDLWMDDIDEQTLLQASQIVESTQGPKNFADAKVDIDPTTLAKLIPKNENDDAIWNEPVRSNKMISTQTVFGDDNAQRGAQPKGRPGFQNSFDVPSMKSGTTMRPPPPRPQQRAIVSGGASSAVPTMDSVEMKEKEIERLKSENRKLAQDQYTKTGEIANLRSELFKRQSFFEKEKKELVKALEMKKAHLEEAEINRRKETDMLRTERDFSKRELQQVMETVEKLRRQLPEALANTSKSLPSLKRPIQEASSVSSLAKRPKVSSNIDESFFEDVKVMKVAKPVVKEISVQTNSKRRRKNVLEVNSHPKDVLSEIVSLTGPMSLVTLAESEAVPSDLNAINGLEHTIITVKCFTAFCQSAAASLVKIKSAIIAASKGGGHANKLPGFEASENKILKQVIADLNAARILISCISEDPKEVRQKISPTSVAALKQIVAILTDKESTFEDELLTNSACLLLRSVFEAGCLDAKPALKLLAEFRTTGRVNRGESESIRRQALSTIRFLEVLKSSTGTYGSVLCSNSESELCFISFVWSEIDKLFCDTAVVTNNDKDEIMSIVKILSTADYANAEKSMNLKVCIAFLGWISSLMSSESFLIRGVDVGGGAGTLKCRSCFNSVLKSFAVVTWSIVSEWSNLKAMGLTPPEDISNAIVCSLLYLHFFLSTDHVSFVKAMAENSYIQRWYIWTTRMLNKWKSEISSKLDAIHGDVLADLSVECDEGGGGI